MRLHTISLACAVVSLFVFVPCCPAGRPASLLPDDFARRTGDQRAAAGREGGWISLDGVEPGQFGAGAASGGGKVFRDPSIGRDVQGTFHIVWTIAWGTHGHKGIGYVRSKDLIHFDEQRLIPVTENEPKTINVWGPESVPGRSPAAVDDLLGIDCGGKIPRNTARLRWP